MTKFLIIRFSSIGDIVLTTPVVRILKKQYSDSEIHYATKSQYNNILENNPYIDKIHLLKKDLKQLIKQLKQENFDIVVDLHNSLRSKIIKYQLNVKKLTVDKINMAKWLIVNMKINILPQKHIVERYIEPLYRINVKNDSEGLDYFLEEKDIVNVSTLPKIFQNGFLAFVIGAKHKTKQLPEQKIMNICNQITYPVILLGGAEDAIVAENIEKNTDDNIWSACGKYTLNQSASIISKAKLVITHDTGLMHIAAAFKKNIISIWGNTIPEFGMYPYRAGKKSQIIQNKNIKCRPCSKIGHQKCPQSHFKCMNDIDELKIQEAINRIFRD